jgi:dihydrofolate reductase
MTRNRVIGQGNGLPWRLPKDLQFFMKTTMGHPVVMGRKTFETMKAPLPGRTNIVVTRDPDYRRAGVLVAGDLTGALALAEAQARQDGRDEIFVAGGAEIYRLALDVATRLYVTEIDAELQGDTFFPELDWSRWRRVRSEVHAPDPSHAYGFTISIFERA